MKDRAPHPQWFDSSFARGSKRLTDPASDAPLLL